MTAPTDAGDDDASPGLANERTMLAWTRTALAYLTVGAVAARTLPSSVPGPARAAVAGVAVVLGGVMWAWSHRCYREREATVAAPGGGDVAQPVALRVVTAGTLALALAAVTTELG